MDSFGSLESGEIESSENSPETSLEEGEIVDSDEDEMYKISKFHIVKQRLMQRALNLSKNPSLTASNFDLLNSSKQNSSERVMEFLESQVEAMDVDEEDTADDSRASLGQTIIHITPGRAQQFVPESVDSGFIGTKSQGTQLMLTENLQVTGESISEMEGDQNGQSQAENEIIEPEKSQVPSKTNELSEIPCSITQSPSLSYKTASEINFNDESDAIESTPDRESSKIVFYSSINSMQLAQNITIIDDKTEKSQPLIELSEHKVQQIIPESIDSGFIGTKSQGTQLLEAIETQSQVVVEMEVDQNAQEMNENSEIFGNESQYQAVSCETMTEKSKNLIEMSEIPCNTTQTQPLSGEISSKSTFHDISEATGSTPDLELSKVVTSTQLNVPENAENQFDSMQCGQNLNETSIITQIQPLSGETTSQISSKGDFNDKSETTGSTPDLESSKVVTSTPLTNPENAENQINSMQLVQNIDKNPKKSQFHTKRNVPKDHNSKELRVQRLIETFDSPQNTENTENFSLGFCTQSHSEPAKKPAMRRVKKRYHARNSMKRILPLMIQEISKIQTVDKGLYCLQDVLFDKVLLYGTCSFVKVKDNKKAVYMLEDGTGTVKFHFDHGSKAILEDQKELRYIRSLAETVQLTQPELAEAHRTLNDIMEKELEEIGNVFESNSRMMIQGHPFYNKVSNKMDVKADSVHVDNDKNRWREIDFKMSVIESYELFFKGQEN